MKKTSTDRRFSLSAFSLILFFMLTEMTSGIIIYTHFSPQDYLLPPMEESFPHSLWIRAISGITLLVICGLLIKQKKR